MYEEAARIAEEGPPGQRSVGRHYVLYKSEDWNDIVPRHHDTFELRYDCHAQAVYGDAAQMALQLYEVINTGVVQADGRVRNANRKFVQTVPLAARRCQQRSQLRRVIEKCTWGPCHRCQRKRDLWLGKGDVVKPKLLRASLPLNYVWDERHKLNTVGILMGGGIIPLEFTVEEYEMVYACPIGEWFFPY